MYETLLFLGSVLSSLFVALLAVRFDRWIADKKELASIISSLGFELAENISIARTITEKAEDDIKILQATKISFAPMPTFSEVAYFRAKNSDIFLNYIAQNKSGIERKLIKNLHECYNSMRLVNSMLESEQEVKLEIMMQRCQKEYGEQLSATTSKTIQEAIEPLLIKTLLLLGKIKPKLYETISLLSEIPTNQG